MGDDEFLRCLAAGFAQALRVDPNWIGDIRALAQVYGVTYTDFVAAGSADEDLEILVDL